MNDYVNDPFAVLARKRGLRARSYFKLEEIDKKFRLFPPGPAPRVLDLGAAPGSWTQYVREKTRNAAEVTAVDLQEIAPFPDERGLYRLCADVFDPSLPLQGRFDLILSDMAPRTSGTHAVDATRSAELVEAVLRLTGRWLAPGGRAVAKYLQGAEMPELQTAWRKAFRQVKLFKPKSSREQSSEVFFVAWDRIDPP